MGVWSAELNSAFGHMHKSGPSSQAALLSQELALMPSYAFCTETPAQMHSSPASPLAFMYWSSLIRLMLPLYIRLLFSHIHAYSHSLTRFWQPLGKDGAALQIRSTTCTGEAQCTCNISGSLFNGSFARTNGAINILADNMKVSASG